MARRLHVLAPLGVVIAVHGAFGMVRFEPRFVGFVVLIFGTAVLLFPLFARNAPEGFGLRALEADSD